MERRRFLYLTGVGGTGLVVLGSGTQDDHGTNAIHDTDGTTSWVLSDDQQAELEAGDQTQAVLLSSVRLVVPAGAAFSLRELGPAQQPRVGDLRYRVNIDSGASLDVIGGVARIAGPFTKASRHFRQQVDDGHFPLPGEGTPLHASETILYQAEEKRRLGRDSAENTFMYVHRDDGVWTAIHVARADRKELVIDVIDRPLPLAA